MAPLPPSGDPATPKIDNPLFWRSAQMNPQVRQSSSVWTTVLGVIFVVVLAVIVFSSLSAGRRSRAMAQTAPSAPAAAPQPAVAPAPVVIPSSPPPTASAILAPARLAQAAPPALASTDPSQTLHAPLMVVDQSEVKPAAGTSANAGAPSSQEHPAAVDASGSPEEKFAARVASSDVETSHATRLGDLTHVAPQGTVIPAVLETAIDSDLPGSVRAVVSQDVRGFDGSAVLIPRGSKLIGQYRSGMAYGQTRAFVVWSRILTPDGVSIDVGGSPGTDPLGRGGLSGETDTHFFERFGSSILLSVLTAGLNLATQTSSNTAIIIGSPVQASSLATMAPQGANIPVTIKVMQGTPLEVFLVRDLDFSDIQAARR